jgi:hypothetical protein
MVRYHTAWWMRRWGWAECPLQDYTFVNGGVLRVHSSELQREGVEEWLVSVGLPYVRVAARPWEESLRNPTTGRYLEVLDIWARGAWPLGTEPARGLIWRYA